MCVCVCACVLGSMCLTFFMLRDVFESLKCCLDLWLSSMLDCIQICVFLFFEKLFLSNLDSFLIALDKQAIYRDPSAFSYRILDSPQYLVRSIEKLSVSLIATSIHRASLLRKPLVSSLKAGSIAKTRFFKAR